MGVLRVVGELSDKPSRSGRTASLSKKNKEVAFDAGTVSRPSGTAVGQRFHRPYAGRDLVGAAAVADHHHVQVDALQSQQGDQGPENCPAGRSISTTAPTRDPCSPERPVSAAVRAAIGASP